MEFNSSAEETAFLLQRARDSGSNPGHWSHQAREDLRLVVSSLPATATASRPECYDASCLVEIRYDKLDTFNLVAEDLDEALELKKWPRAFTGPAIASDGTVTNALLVFSNQEVSQ